MDNVEDGGKDRPAPGLKLSPNVEGALWMLASAGFFTLMTTLVKFLAEDYPAPLQIFYRQMFSFLTIVPLLVRKGPGVFKATRPGILFFRAAAGTLGLVLANYSFQYLDLATANALSFTRGLWIAPLALIILSERVDSVRVGASLVGFSGVMLIVGWEVGAPASFWPMAAGMGSALLFAFTIIGAKIVTRDHSVLTIMAWATVLGVVFLVLSGALLLALADSVGFCAIGPHGRVRGGRAILLCEGCPARRRQRHRAGRLHPHRVRDHRRILCLRRDTHMDVAVRRHGCGLCRPVPGLAGARRQHPRDCADRSAGVGID